MIVGPGGLRHKIAAHLSHIYEVGHSELSDVVEKFAGAEFSAKSHCRAVV